MLSFLFTGAIAWGQTTQPAGGADREPDYPRATRVPVDVLDPPRAEAIILPSEPAESVSQISGSPAGLIGNVEPGVRLLPDGYAIANRPATFLAEQPWAVLDLERVEGLPDAGPLRILPNRQLMLLERVVSTGRGPDKLLVTGRVTEFLGRNYILLEQVVAPSQARGVESPTGPAANLTASRPAQPPSAEEIIEQLMREAPGSALRAAEVATRSARPSATEGTKGVEPEGTLVPETPGRLVPAGGTWTFVRESKGDRPSSAVYNLLPNRLLEVMVSSSRGGTRPVVFKISGELTEYRGQNHLLVRKVLIQRDMGNLR
jgi:hypothetical protein